MKTFQLRPAHSAFAYLPAGVLWFSLLCQAAQAQTTPPAPWRKIIYDPTKGNVGGPNWVINSGGGYGAASGTFTRKGQMWPNPKNTNKPTLYLGATGGGVEVDAGFQYEQFPKDGVGPGWSLVLSTSTGGWNLWQQPLDRVADSDFGSRQISFSLSANGIATLSASGFPTRTSNMYQVPKAKLSVASVKMKRVIGITQQQGWDFLRDGSYFLGNEFSCNSVTVYASPNSPLDHWPTTGSVGIFKPPTASGKNPGGLRVVNMDAPWTRLEPSGDLQDPDAHSPNRYTDETVSIDLRSKAQIQQMALRRGQTR